MVGRTEEVVRRGGRRSTRDKSRQAWLLPIIGFNGGSRTRSGWRRLANDCKASVGS